jgi:hypothetical protein
LWVGSHQLFTLARRSGGQNLPRLGDREYAWYSVSRQLRTTIRRPRASRLDLVGLDRNRGCRESNWLPVAAATILPRPPAVRGRVLPHSVIWLGLEAAVPLSHEDAARLLLERLLLLGSRLLLQRDLRLLMSIPGSREQMRICRPRSGRWRCSQSRQARHPRFCSQGRACQPVNGWNLLRRWRRWPWSLGKRKTLTLLSSLKKMKRRRRRPLLLMCVAHGVCRRRGCRRAGVGPGVELLQLNDLSFHGTFYPLAKCFCPFSQIQVESRE